jgi:hypothetical protein
MRFRTTGDADPVVAALDARSSARREPTGDDEENAEGSQR